MQLLECSVAEQFMLILSQIDTKQVLTDFSDRDKILANINTLCEDSGEYYITVEWEIGNMVKHHNILEAVEYLDYLGHESFMFWGKVDNSTRISLSNIK